MIFNGIVNIDGLELTYTLLHMDGVHIGNHELFCHIDYEGEFIVASSATFALGIRSLYLFGNQDRDDIKFPSSSTIRFPNQLSLDYWIKLYKLAFNSINKCEPVIIDETIPEFEMEDTPEFGVV
jgi:hypothetical protein